MDRTTPNLADGVIGLAMLAMLTVAIVAGQARATPDANVESMETGRIIAVPRAPLDGHE